MMGNSSDDRYEVIVSDRASEMLVQHVMFLAKESSSAAERLRLEIIEALGTLEQFPQRCPWFQPELIPANKYRKLIVGKRYLVIFQVRDNCVFVDYVLDCRMDYGWLL